MTDRPWEVCGDCVLVLGDWHQRIAWIDAVLEHEEGQFDHLVLLGDAMDAFEEPPAVAGARATAKHYAGLIQRPATTVLLGNHDCCYLECHSHAVAHRHKRPLFNGCSGFTHSKAIEFAKEMTYDLWRKVKLFAVVNGWLVSHAGFREDNWHSNLAVDENLGHLWRQSEEALENAPFRPHRLFACGIARHGTEPWGGPLWLNWDDEFEDNLPLPQAVGHSHHVDMVRKMGRSYCIDTGSGYALIRRDGSIEHKRLKRDWSHDDRWVWMADAPLIRDDTERMLARQQSTNPDMLEGCGQTVDPIGDMKRLFDEVTKEEKP